MLCPSESLVELGMTVRKSKVDLYFQNKIETAKRKLEIEKAREVPDLELIEIIEVYIQTIMKRWYHYGEIIGRRKP